MDNTSIDKAGSSKGTDKTIEERDTLEAAPSVRHHTVNILRDFKIFRRDYLNCPDLKQPFSIDDVIRFLEALRQTMELPNGQKVPKEDSLRRAYDTIQAYGHLTFDNYAVTQRDTMRFKAYMGILHRQKEIEP